jgi:hypothetical protein
MELYHLECERFMKKSMEIENHGDVRINNG